MKKLVLLLALISAFFLVSVSSAGSAPQTFHVLILLVNYTDTPASGYTNSQAVTDFNTNLAPYFVEQSYNTVGFTVESHGFYQLPFSSTDPCSLGNIENSARAAAQADGVNTANFDHFAYLISGGVPSCGGIAYGGGSLTEGDMWGGLNLLSVGIGRHEFAHSIGINHTDGLGPTGGNNTDRLPAAALSQLNWLDIPYVTDGTYTLTSVEQPSGLRGIAVARPDGSRIVVEYRKATPQTAAEMLVESDNGYFSYIYRYNTNPCGRFTLTPGQNYYDSASRILLTSSAPNSVTVQTNADAPVPQPDTTPPTTPVLSAAKKGNSVSLSWSASQDTSCTITYKVYKNGNLFATTTSIGVSDSAPARKTTVSYKVQAVDDSGNVSAFSNIVSISG